MWGPHVRLNQKRKRKRAAGSLGSKHSWAGSVAQLGSAHTGWSAPATAHRPAQEAAWAQRGRLSVRLGLLASWAESGPIPSSFG
jgi:hypothetical protein